MHDTVRTLTSVPSVLIVDDSRVNIEIMRQILSPEYRTFRACNGQQALDLARTYPPDLILLDVEMPGMDGYQVCATLKSDPRTRDIPIIFVTGMDDAESFEKGYAAGAAGFLTKPVDPAAVRSQVFIQLCLAHAQGLLAGKCGECVEPEPPAGRLRHVG
jgi:CheY-like chemotaxis protein